MADLLALLQEISPDNPCGDYLEYDAAYLELGKNVLGKPEDPITGEQAQPPNWREIYKESTAILQQSKDLQVTVYLLRSLINIEGLTGFRDALDFLHALLEKYWEPIHPVLDPDDDLDPTARVNILEELSHFESVLRPLSLAILVDAKSAGRFNLRDIQLATGKIDVPEGVVKPDISLIQAAFMDAPEDMVQANYQAVLDSITLLQSLEKLVGDKVGVQNGPDLSALAAVLKEIRYVFDQYAQSGLTDVSESADDGPAEEQTEAAITRKPAALGGIASRQDVLKTLDLICKYYAEHEPSSPVPILLQRARKLVTADFMEIVQNLLPDGLSQLQQIKGPEPDENNY